LAYQPTGFQLLVGSQIVGCHAASLMSKLRVARAKKEIRQAGRLEIFYPLPPLTKN